MADRWWWEQRPVGCVRLRGVDYNDEQLLLDRDEDGYAVWHFSSGWAHLFYAGDSAISAGRIFDAAEIVLREVAL